MNSTRGEEDKERIAAEIAALERWRKDMDYFLASGLRDPSVSSREISDAVAMATRVLVRLKSLHLKMASE